MAPLPHIYGTARLRRLRASDLAAFQAYRRDPEIARYQGWDDMDDRAAEGFLSAMEVAPPFPVGWLQIGVTWAEAGAGVDDIVGDMGLCVSETGEDVELGITLCREA